MIREIVIDGRKKMVFLLEEGPAAYIVIPFDSINHVDYKRIKDLIGTDKSLMAAMLNNKLDNGKNCLQLYQHIIKVVYKKTAAKPILIEGSSTPPLSLASETAPSASAVTTPVTKRRSGRPKKTAAPVVPTPEAPVI